MLLQIAVPIAVFTLIVLSLSAIVLVARSRLTPSGPVTIEVNGRRVLNVNAGSRLLWLLAQNDIHLPAACGGRGTCGQCRVKVTSGGGPPLPTEALHIEPGEAAKGVRLACLLKVRESMRITVPQSVLDVRRWTCEVVSNRQIATHLKELTLKLPESERIRFAAGAYVLLEAPPHRIAFRDFDIDAEYRDEWDRFRLFDFESVVRQPVLRAYSLANPPREDDRAVLVVRIAIPPATAPAHSPPGQVSSYVFSLKAGDRVSISGPFGDFHASENEKEMVCIAGGVGIAPIRSIILDQLVRRTGRQIALWYGARDLGDLCYAKEFNDVARQFDNFEFHAALSDPHESDTWAGHTGFIHIAVYEHYLKNHPAPQDVEYYLCGPPVMSQAVVAMLEQLGVERSNIFFDDFGEG